MIGVVAALVVSSVVVEPSTPPERPALQAGSEPQTGLTASPISIRFPGRSRSAPTHYEPLGGLIVFKANVEGREVWALLDNGAERSLIDATFAEETGSTIGPPNGTIITPSGSIPKRRVSDVSLEVPYSFAVDLPAVAAMDMEPISQLLGRDIDFVLGGDLLRFFILAINPSQRTFRVGPSGAARMGPDAISTAVDPDSAQIELLIGGEPVRLMIDLGSNAALTLSPEAWGRVAPSDVETRQTSVADGNGRIEQITAAVAPEVTVAGMLVRDVRVNIRPVRPDVADGFVGNGFLDRFSLLLDLGQGRLWLRPSTE